MLRKSGTGLPGQHVRLEAQGFGQGYSARSFLACSRALPSARCKPRNHNFTFHPGGRCAAAPAKLRLPARPFAAQNTRIQKKSRNAGGISARARASR